VGMECDLRGKDSGGLLNEASPVRPGVEFGLVHMVAWLGLGLGSIIPRDHVPNSFLLYIIPLCSPVSGNGRCQQYLNDLFDWLTQNGYSILTSSERRW
jgi:hypothetical protein